MSPKYGIIISLISILVITVLEFPAPVGFETRPQNHVSLFWLVFFLIIVVTEIAAFALIFKHPKLGSKFGIIAGVLNIFQVLADQLHLMQPETASLIYSLLESSVVLISLCLIFFSQKLTWQNN